jgi:peptidoglycan/xylan/chitin deacetylase (PgdA/CDA1 family)
MFETLLLVVIIIIMNKKIKITLIVVLFLSLIASGATYYYLRYLPAKEQALILERNEERIEQLAKGQTPVNAKKADQFDKFIEDLVKSKKKVRNIEVSEFYNGNIFSFYNKSDGSVTTFDFDTEKFVKIQDLFKKVEGLKPISEELRTYIQKSEKIQKGSETEKLLLQNLKPDYAHFKDFVLNGSEITFLLNSRIESLNIQRLTTLMNPVFITDEMKKAGMKDKTAIKLIDLPVVDPTLKNKKLIALTFDDGPNNISTPNLLKYLKAQNVHATFFTLGQQVKAYPEIVKEAYKNGNQIGSHTWDHKDLRTLSNKEIKQEINSTSDIIQKTIGVKPNVLRPPYGSFNKEVQKANNGQAIVLWSIDSLDWKTRNADSIYRDTMSQVTDGGIILMHDIYGTSVEGAKRVIPELKKKGFTFVTIDELIASRSKFVAGKDYYEVMKDGRTR